VARLHFTPTCVLYACRYLSQYVAKIKAQKLATAAAAAAATGSAVVRKTAVVC